MKNKAEKMKTKRKGQARLDVWLKEDTKQRLKDIAKKLDVTVAEYVRSVLNKNFEEIA